MSACNTCAKSGACITLEFEWVTPSLNEIVNRAAKGQHWFKAKERDKWAEAAMLVMPPGWEGGSRKVKMQVFSYRRRKIDKRNFEGGMKYMEDGFVRAGLIRDDSEKWLENGEHQQITGPERQGKIGTIVILEIVG